MKFNTSEILSGLKTVDNLVLSFRSDAFSKRCILDLSLVSNATREFKMDFDVVLKNIRELNILAGEGCSEVTRTKDGARLKV